MRERKENDWGIVMASISLRMPFYMVLSWEFTENGGDIRRLK
jgi:hypothetical protein